MGHHWINVSCLLDIVRVETRNRIYSQCVSASVYIASVHRRGAYNTSVYITCVYNISVYKTSMYTICMYRNVYALHFSVHNTIQASTTKVSKA